jgi:hypothetical protein
MKQSFVYILLLCSSLVFWTACSKSEEMKLAPSELSYGAEPVIEFTEGTAKSSPVPTLNGTGPFTFSIQSTPATSDLKIDNQGVITATSTIKPGSYRVKVLVKNEVTTQTFDNALTVFVNSKSGVTFVKDIQPITKLSCSFSGCHPNYLNHQEVAGTITVILNRIQRAPGTSGFMPRAGAGAPNLTAAQIELFKQWVTDGKKER